MNIRKKRKDFLFKVLLTVFAGLVAIVFLMPTVLTITNSFMTSSEISANYGVMFDNISSDKKTYISDTLNLKFIPDKVSFSQYFAVLFKSPEYLLKFWNSVILVVPITFFHIVVALFASYSLPFRQIHIDIHRLVRGKTQSRKYPLHFPTPFWH